MTDHGYRDDGAVLAPDTSSAESPIDGLVMGDLGAPPNAIDGEASSTPAEASASPIVDVDGDVEARAGVVSSDLVVEDGAEADALITLDATEPALLHAQDAAQGRASP